MSVIGGIADINIDTACPSGAFDTHQPTPFSVEVWPILTRFNLDLTEQEAIAGILGED
jgi:hypothetical protein